MENDLRLSEKLILLSINPEKEGLYLSARNNLPYVLTGALLMEMVHEGEAESKGKRIQFKAHFPECKTHSFILDKSKNANGDKRIKYWLNKFYPNKKIRNIIYERLKKDHLIRLEQKKFLFFKWLKPHLTNEKARRQIIKEVDHAIFRGDCSVEDMMLLALLEPLAIYNKIYREREKRKSAKRKVKELFKRSEVPAFIKDIAPAVRSTIIASRAATMAAAT